MKNICDGVNEITERKTKNVKFKRLTLKFKKNYLKNL